MKVFAILSLLAIGATSTPTPQLSDTSSLPGILKKRCTTYNSIPLTVTSINKIFSVPKFVDNYDVTDFTTDLASRVSNTTFFPFGSPLLNKTQTATYTLAGTFCTPLLPSLIAKNNTKTILLATHGLNFNRGYWDSAYQPEKYSFVDAAIEEGYSIFFYDRLGVGKSQRVSGYVNQLNIQIALGIELTKAIKAGKYTGAVGKPEKVVLLGHSYGSGISAGIVAAEVGLVDGVVLTGFSFNGSTPNAFVQASQFRIASGERPLTWGGLDTGYLTPVDIYANVNAFFKKPDYSIQTAQFAEASKEPIAITEALTAADLFLDPIYFFKGAALVIAGQFDFVFCSSQCDSVINAGSGLFANAKAYKAVSYPGAGHGLNFALNADGAFKIILDFVKTNV